jgi:hypothetical protein
VAYAIELYFDEAAEQSVRAISHYLAEIGVLPDAAHGEARPRLKLAVYETLADDGWFLATLEEFAGVFPALDLSLSSVGMLPPLSDGTRGEGSTIFLGVTPTHALLEIHAALHGWFADYRGGLRPQYAASHWLPHCVVATGLSPEQVAFAMQCCTMLHLPITATARTLGFAEASPASQPLHEFAVWRL